MNSLNDFQILRTQAEQQLFLAMEKTSQSIQTMTLMELLRLLVMLAMELQRRFSGTVPDAQTLVVPVVTIVHTWMIRTVST